MCPNIMDYILYMYCTQPQICQYFTLTCYTIEGTIITKKNCVKNAQEMLNCFAYWSNVCPKGNVSEHCTVEEILKFVVSEDFYFLF